MPSSYMLNYAEKHRILKDCVRNKESLSELLEYLKLYKIDFIIFYGKPIFLCSQLSKARCNRPMDFQRRFLKELDVKQLDEMVIAYLTGLELKEFRREWTIQCNSDLPHRDYKLLVCDWSAALGYLSSFEDDTPSTVLGKPNQDFKSIMDQKRTQIPIPSYRLEEQDWFIGVDLAKLAGRKPGHFKDFPRSLEKQGITEGFLRLEGEKLKQFKLYNAVPNSASTSSLYICNLDIALLYLNKFNYFKSEVNNTQDLGQEVGNTKEQGNEPEAPVEVEGGELKKEFEEYAKKYNIKPVSWNYQDWYIGNSLSLALNKNKFHFNSFGQANKASTELKCLLLKGPALNQFKQAALNSFKNLSLTDKVDNPDLDGIKFFTTLFICDWRAALKYLKEYENEEQETNKTSKKPMSREEIKVFITNIRSQLNQLELYLNAGV